ncbi:hypothetical protein GCM10020369_09420 [Cryptosporangium minutisporangium]|uniref:Beta-xylanase n=1 Tax=Cryptosporangium minutisporangium TaxID=113569 RepID=A0ABP6SRV4_9ACTN
MIRTSRHTRIAARVGALLVALLLAAGLAPSAAAVAKAGPKAPVVPGLTLRQLAALKGVTIGAGATNPAYFSDPRFGQVLAKQFNSLSPENELKWSFIQPERGKFDFSKIDQLVRFAKQNRMAVKGHGLLSGGVNPEWVLQITDPADLRAALTNHIRTIMTRYRGTIDRWDVVTEVFSTFGGTGLDQNHFYKVLGPDYIAETFRIAHAANPKAKLFLNESLVEYYPAKQQELYALVADMVAKGVPITGVGLETHETQSAPAPGVMTDIVKSYRALGLDVAITEMDVHVLDSQLQADIYRSVLAEALAAGVRDISFWGFTDAHHYTWVPGAKPLLFDEQYNPKPAFFAARTALAECRCRR